MESWERAAPGVEQHAEQAVEAAWNLADVAGPGGWSTAAAEDALDAIDTLTEALGGADPELARTLAAVAAALPSASPPYTRRDKEAARRLLPELWADASLPTAEVCRRLGISRLTARKWA
ncbi:hypothetical protein [Streptomyces filamentosus]|uniref:hypothetical protein n=1 Tax=Streptomyces filamentosus TaxID=67294 RepID=UPI003406206F